MQRPITPNDGVGKGSSDVNPPQLELESGNGSWYCTNCKADCGLCSGAVLYGHKSVQCDKCEMWIHNKCSLITESEFGSV